MSDARSTGREAVALLDRTGALIAEQRRVLLPAVLIFALPVNVASVALTRAGVETPIAIDTVTFLFGVPFWEAALAIGAAAPERLPTRTVLRRALAAWPRALATRALALVLITIGSILIAPGLVMMTRYWTAPTVAALEQRGPRAAQVRSAELVEGSGAALFAAIVVCGIAYVFVSIATLLALRLHPVLSSPVASVAAGCVTDYASTLFVALAVACYERKR